MSRSMRNEQNSTFDKRLRQDLRITEEPNATAGSKRFRLENPATNEMFECDEKEFFLANELGTDRSLEEILKEFRNRFGIDLSTKDYLEYIELLDSIGILESSKATDRPVKQAKFRDQATEQRNGARARIVDPPDIPENAAEISEDANKPSELTAGRQKRIVLFDPDRMFRFLARLFRPLRYLAYLIFPAIIFAGVAVLNEQTVFIAATKKIFGSLSFIEHIMISLVSVNLVSKLFQGITIARYGIEVHEFGLRLAIGIIPRFYIDHQRIRSLPRREQLWCHGAPLLTKLGLCACGIFIWAVMHRTGSGIAVPALVLGQIGFGAFLFTANPLWRADGYRFLTTLLQMPRLREQGFRLLKLTFAGKKPPQGLGDLERWGLQAFAILSVIYTVAIIGLLLATVSISLEKQFEGTGVVLSLVLVALVMTFVYGTLMRKKLRARQKAASRNATGRELTVETEAPEQQSPRGRERRLAARQQQIYEVTEPRRGSTRRWPGWVKLGLWAGIVGIIVYVALLPYPYEVGGEFLIQPNTRVEVRARTNGETLRVLVKEGEWVEKDKVLAILSDWDEKRDVAVTSAELDKARAELKTLKGGAKPEEIKQAEKRIESARVEVEFSLKQLNRTTALLEKKITTAKQMDIDQNRHALAIAKHAEAKAHLDLVRAGARDSEIEAASAEVKRLEHELDYKKAQLERTRIRAPQAGRIVTPRISHKLGAFLPEGGLFLELEDNRTVRAEIEVPEADIEDVKVNAKVRIKPWSEKGGHFVGSVVRKSPKAETRSFGKIVRVTIEVPNPDGRLRSNMTGYGKIRADDRPTWQAFTRVFVRFFTIEMWSWLP